MGQNLYPLFKTVNIFTKASEEAKEFSKRLKNWLNSYAIKSEIFENLADLESEKNIKDSDLLVVLGGDGSILIAARRIAKYGIPILGINLGRLGFLTEIKKEEAFDKLYSVLSRPLCVSRRIMLRATLIRDGKKILEADVLSLCSSYPLYPEWTKYYL
jgi:NAD+ kinase